MLMPTGPGWWRSAVCSGGMILLITVGAFAADAKPPEASEATFLVQIIVLILSGRGLGELMQRIGQPSVMGQLIAGLLLGPSLFGWLWPDAQHAIFPANPAQKAMVDGIAQFGVLLLLLLTGMETDLKLVRKVGRASAAVSIAGIVIPFAIGFALGEFLPVQLLAAPEHRLIAALFLGTTLSISSVKIVAMIVREMKFMRRNVGQVLVAAAVIDDTIGWIIVAMIFSLASHGTIDAAALAQSVLGTALFLAVSLTIGRRLVFSLIRWANDHLVSDAAVITVILLLMGGMALTTHLIGVHSVLGAFVAGILVGESPILTRRIDDQLRGLITSLFMPVFFGLAGLSADLTILKDPMILLLTGGMILVASVGKFAGAFIGGEVGGMTRRESLALACGMNARGSTEVIVASIGLAMGVLSQNLFTMIVAMAVITTMVMPPTLRWALARVPLGKAEKARLEREAYEETGFVANLERLLLAVDDSANGKFASRLAGLIAGARGIPITLLHLGRHSRRQTDNRRRQGSPETAVKEGAQATAAVEAEAEDQKPPQVDITTRAGGAKTGAKTEDTVAEEARKGYDLLVTGIERSVAAHGAFHAELASVAKGFEGPLAVVIARGPHLERADASALRILVPITGTDVSRRASEVAVVLARANDVAITALYIANTSDGGRRRGISATRVHEEEILKDVVALAERYDTEMRTAVRVDAEPDEAILREARSGRYNLIVMGVNRRPGNVLFFGNVAAAIVEKAKASVVFVSG